ncbi:MAG: thioredoxin family protein [Bacteroidota bacterium]
MANVEMVVKILGTGCSRCRLLEQKVREVAEKHNVDCVIEKVSELDQIMAYGIMMTPGLVVNDIVKSSGKIPKDEQILQWLVE